PALPGSGRPPRAARHAWAAALAAAWWLLDAPPSAAQATGTVDVGVSSVRYDGFLPSGAASVSPALRWERPAGILTARGTYLRFESGHRSLQSLLAGSFLIRPAAHRWRGALGGSLGASRYLDFASCGGGRGVFGEASATLAVGERTVLFVAGGRYPTDPVSGSVAGRYVSGGVRLRLASPARLSARTTIPSASRPGTPADGDPVADLRLEVLPRPNGVVRLVLYVASTSAAGVWLAGALTDSQP